MKVKIIEVNDEILSSTRYEIRVNNKFYVGNLSKSGLKYWTGKLDNKI